MYTNRLMPNSDFRRHIVGEWSIREANFVTEYFELKCVLTQQSITCVSMLHLTLRILDNITERDVIVGKLRSTRYPRQTEHVTQPTGDPTSVPISLFLPANISRQIT